MPRRLGSKRRRPRRTLLKIRAVPLVRMPKSRFFMLIREACKTGVVPNEIEITTLNWDHALGGRYMPGTILSAKHKAELQACYDYLSGAIGKSDVRVETPR